MKTVIQSVTLSIGADLVSLSLSGGALLVTSSQKGIVCHCVKGYVKHPRKSLAEYVTSLPADDQLDTLEAIRAAGRLVCPANVSDKTAVEFYPEITVRI